MNKITPSFDSTAKTLTVTFPDDIDENSIFADWPAQPFKKVILDFEKVKMINSIGVREWVKWISHIPKDVDIIYRNCTRPVVVQMGLIGGFFRQGAQVDSFEVPYSCPKCAQQFSVLFKQGIDFKKGVIGTLEKQCPKCGASGELDVVETTYFRFLSKGG